MILVARSSLPDASNLAQCFIPPRASDENMANHRLSQDETRWIRVLNASPSQHSRYDAGSLVCPRCRDFFAPAMAHGACCSRSAGKAKCECYLYKKCAGCLKFKSKTSFSAKGTCRKCASPAATHLVVATTQQRLLEVRCLKPRTFWRLTWCRVDLELTVAHEVHERLQQLPCSQIFEVVLSISVAERTWSTRGLHFHCTHPPSEAGAQSRYATAFEYNVFCDIFGGDPAKMPSSDIHASVVVDVPGVGQFTQPGAIVYYHDQATANAYSNTELAIEACNAAAADIQRFWAVVLLRKANAARDGSVATSTDVGDCSATQQSDEKTLATKEISPEEIRFVGTHRHKWASLAEKDRHVTLGLLAPLVLSCDFFYVLHVIVDMQLGKLVRDVVCSVFNRYERCGMPMSKLILEFLGCNFELARRAALKLRPRRTIQPSSRKARQSVEVRVQSIVRVSSGKVAVGARETMDHLVSMGFDYETDDLEKLYAALGSKIFVDYVFPPVPGTWLRATERWESVETVPLTEATERCTFRTHGCWLTTALNVRGLVANCLDDTCESKRQTGLFRVWLCHGGQWRQVTVDDFFPCDSVPRQLLHWQTPREGGVCAPLILEKAMAKLHGGYDYLPDGHAHDVLVDLTGSPVVCYDVTELRHRFGVLARCLRTANCIAVATAAHCVDSDVKPGSKIVAGGHYSLRSISPSDAHDNVRVELRVSGEAISIPLDEFCARFKSISICLPYVPLPGKRPWTATRRRCSFTLGQERQGVFAHMFRLRLPQDAITYVMAHQFDSRALGSPTEYSALAITIFRENGVGADSRYEYHESVAPLLQRQVICPKTEDGRRWEQGDYVVVVWTAVCNGLKKEPDTRTAWPCDDDLSWSASAPVSEIFDRFDTGLKGYLDACDIDQLRRDRSDLTIFEDQQEVSKAAFRDWVSETGIQRVLHDFGYEPGNHKNHVPVLASALPVVLSVHSESPRMDVVEMPHNDTVIRHVRRLATTSLPRCDTTHVDGLGCNAGNCAPRTSFRAAADSISGLCERTCGACSGLRASRSKSCTRDLSAAFTRQATLVDQPHPGKRASNTGHVSMPLKKCRFQ